MRILFLDIDGVLRTNYEWFTESGIKLNKTSMENLRDIVFSTDCYIVVSSTWRKGSNDPDDYCWKSLLENLESYDLRERLIDVTPVIYEKNGEVNRGIEIREWLKNHIEVTSFVILDDYDDMEEFTSTKLVKCNPSIGIDTSIKEKAIAILNSHSGLSCKTP